MKLKLCLLVLIQLDWQHFLIQREINSILFQKKFNVVSSLTASFLFKNKLLFYEIENKYIDFLSKFCSAYFRYLIVF